MWVITYSDEEGVRLAVERLRQQVEAERLTFGERTVVITASFGIAGCRRVEQPDFQRVLVQADVALHSAKRLGRNRVEIVWSKGH